MLGFLQSLSARINKRHEKVRGQGHSKACLTTSPCDDDSPAHRTQDAGGLATLSTDRDLRAGRCACVGKELRCADPRAPDELHGAPSSSAPSTERASNAACRFLHTRSPPSDMGRRHRCCWRELGARSQQVRPARRARRIRAATCRRATTEGEAGPRAPSARRTSTTASLWDLKAAASHRHTRA